MLQVWAGGGGGKDISYLIVKFTIFMKLETSTKLSENHQMCKR